MANPISNLGTIPTLTVGGRVFVDLTNLIMVGGSTSGAATTQYSTLRKPDGISGYTPSGALSLKMNAISFFSTYGSGVSTVYFLGYGDTDIGFSSASAPTNPKYIFGDTTPNPISSINNGDTTVNGRTHNISINFTLPNTKYMFFKKTNAPSAQEEIVTAYGYEQ